MLDYRFGWTPSAAELEILYNAVGWSSYTAQPENLAPMVENSWLKIAAYDGEYLVGLVRVVGDGLAIAYIQDLLILPDYQKQGIGEKLMSLVLEKVEGMRQVFISTDSADWNAHVVNFYQKLGFKPVGDLECVTLARFA